MKLASFSCRRPQVLGVTWSPVCGGKPGLLLHKGASRGRKGQKLESLAMCPGGIADINPSRSGLEFGFAK